MKVLSKICSVCLCLCFLLQMNVVIIAKAYDAGVMPCYDYVQLANAYLSFANDVAKCKITIYCLSDTEKITGTITLYDETAGKNVASRTVYQESAIYTNSFSVDVTAGHKYTLSYSGYVYGQDGSYDAVSASVTKEN